MKCPVSPFRILSVFILALCAVPFLHAGPVSADVKVLLKNGREITADSCRPAGNKLVCSRMGGTFEIDRKDVAGIEAAGDAGASDEPPMAEPSEKSDVSAPEGAGKKDLKSQSAAQEEVSGIRERKTQLLSDREKLVRERSQLQEDLKNAPDWMTVKRFDELKKRNDDLGRQIEEFNQEVKELNEKENKIRQETNPEAAPAEDAGPQ